MFEGLAEIDGVKTFKPTGAFYLFTDVSRLYDKLDGFTDSIGFCDYLLEKCRIARIPGQAFGEDRCVRFSFAADEASIHEGLLRLSQI